VQQNKLPALSQWPRRFSSRRLPFDAIESTFVAPAPRLIGPRLLL